MLDKLDTLKDFHMQKSMGLKVMEWRFAALIAVSYPLEYCLKYGDNLNLAENALQAGYRFSKVKGGSIEMTSL